MHADTLIEDDRFRLITFTGSARTGRHLMSEAGRRMKRVAMELGGNAPFVVFADADLEQAADDLVALKCTNAGQVCMAGTRLLLQKEIHDDFVNALTEAVRAVKPGQVLVAGTDLIGKVPHP